MFLVFSIVLLITDSNLETLSSISSSTLATKGTSDETETETSGDTIFSNMDTSDFWFSHSEWGDFVSFRGDFELVLYIFYNISIFGW